jgi:hypothetical protein
LDLEFSSQKFAHPTLRYSPANVTKGDGSQAMCSAKVTGIGGPSVFIPAVIEPLEGTVKDIADKRQTRRWTKVKEKQLKTKEISYECLEAGGKQGNGKEPELCSEDESSSANHQGTMPKLPSSSGTSLSSGMEGDHGEENSVDSKGRTGSLEEEGDSIRLPILKSYDPKLVSPQEVLKTKVATECHMEDSQEFGSPLIDLPIMEVQESPTIKNCRGEEREGNTEVEQIHVAEEDPGSECLHGRQSERRDGTPIAAINKDSEGHCSTSLEKPPDMCLNSPREEPAGSDFLGGHLSSGKKGKKTRKDVGTSNEKQEKEAN